MNSSAPLVLLVEDQVLIANEVAIDLLGAGYAVAGPFQKATDALRWLEGGGRPNAAIIDLGMADGRALDLARELRALHVPFLVYSVALHKDAVASEVSEAPWLVQPASFDLILEHLDVLLGQVAGGCRKARRYI